MMKYAIVQQSSSWMHIWYISLKKQLAIFMWKVKTQCKVWLKSSFILYSQDLTFLGMHA